MKKIALLIIFTCFFFLGNATGNENNAGTSNIVEIQKWYGPDGYIKLKNSKLYVSGVIYFPSKKSANKWHGPGGYIKLKNGKLYMTNGHIYYPSKK